MTKVASAHTRRKAVTRDAIVDAAFAMLREAPGAGFSHEAIAAQTGIAARTIYRHFPTRANLTEALWLRMREQTAIEWPDSEAGIVPAVHALFKQFEEHSVLVRAAITAAATTDYPVHGSAEGRAAFKRTLAELLSKLPDKEAEQLVAACVAVYSAPFWQMLRDRGRLSSKSASETAAWVIDAVIASARVRVAAPQSTQKEEQMTMTPTELFHVLEADAGRTLAPLNIVGERTLVKVSAADSDGQLAFFHLVAPPMSGPPRHVHSREDELFYVLEGELVFELDGQRFPVGPGGTVYLRRGVVHAYQNFTAADARLLIATTPGGFSQFFVELSAATPLGGMPDFEVLNALARKYGITTLGPPMTN
jgi:mannose-6-phosphate isomerase-like protein (cupin superfamily)